MPVTRNTLGIGWESSGDSISKDTMQKSGSAWITGVPTPGVANVTGSSSGSGTGNGSGNTSGSGTTSSGATTTTSSVTKPKTEQEYWQEYVKQLDPDPKYSARMIVPDTVVEHVPVKFSAVVKKFDLITVLEGKYEWSMGDGQSYVFRQNTPITYTYQQPGEYVVMMKYYSNVFKEEPDSLHQKTIVVIPASVQTVVDVPTGAITLTNTSTGDIDLYQWKLQSFTGDYFTFVTSTILRKNASITIPASVHHLPYVSNKGLQLVTPDGYRVTATPSTVKTYQSYTSSSYEPVISSQNQLISSSPVHEIDSPESLYQVPQSASIAPFANKSFSRSWLFIALFIFGIISAVGGFHIISQKPEQSST
jgi:hypothetical protein